MPNVDAYYIRYSCILRCNAEDENECLSFDFIDKIDVDTNEAFDVLITEFLKTLTMSGLPHHRIKLKVGTPVMLLRNIDQSKGYAMEQDSSLQDWKIVLLKKILCM